jgi:hypothetical protein
VNRALVRDLEQPLLLIRVEISYQVNLALDPIDLALLGFAIPAIDRVNLRMSKIHRYAFERPLLRPRVQGYRHRRAGTECREKQIVRSWPGILPSKLDRLVCGQPMWTNNDFLGKSSGVAAHNYIGGTHAFSLRLVSITASSGS